MMIGADQIAGVLADPERTRRVVIAAAVALNTLEMSPHELRSEVKVTAVRTDLSAAFATTALQEARDD